MEKGGPPYAADGSLDYAESGFLRMPSRFNCSSCDAQWKTRSVYFLPLSLTRLAQPPLSLPSFHHHYKILHSK